MSTISIVDLVNPATIMNENYVGCKSLSISSIQRVIYLFINNKLLYTTTLDDILKYFDEIRYPNQVIDASDPEFVSILLDYGNKLINSSRSGSRYLMKIKNDNTNIKVYIGTVCQNKYNNPNLQTKPGIFRP